MVNQGATILELAKACMPRGLPWYRLDYFVLDTLGTRVSFSAPADKELLIRRITLATNSDPGARLEVKKNGVRVTNSCYISRGYMRSLGHLPMIFYGTKGSPTVAFETYDFVPPVLVQPDDTITVVQTDATSSAPVRIAWLGSEDSLGATPTTTDLANYNFLPQEPYGYELFEMTLTNANPSWTWTVPSGQIWYPLYVIVGTQSSTDPNQNFRTRVGGRVVFRSWGHPEWIVEGMDYGDYLNWNPVFNKGQLNLRPLMKLVATDTMVVDFEAVPSSGTSVVVALLVAKYSA